MKKLDIHSRVELARFAIREGLADRLAQPARSSPITWRLRVTPAIGDPHSLYFVSIYPNGGIQVEPSAFDDHKGH